MAKKKASSKKAPSKKNKITLTIRAKKPAEVKALNDLLESTNEKTYSGALMKVAMSNKADTNQRAGMVVEINRLKNQLNDIREVVDNHYNSTKALADFSVKQKHKPYRTGEE